MITSGRTPVAVRTGATLSVVSGLLYAVATVYYVVATLTEDHVRSGDLPMRDGTGIVLATFTAICGALSFTATWSGVRTFRRGDPLVAYLLFAAGTALGLLPAYVILFVPQSA